MGLRINMGCGSAHRQGYLNVDIDPGCNPDRIMDMQDFPWAFDDNSVEELVLVHVLEHVGQTTDDFRSVIQEMHRVMQHDGRVHVVVPDPAHDHFEIDPTHVRAIRPELFMMLSKVRNAEWQSGGLACSPLARSWNVDFEVVKVERELDPGFKAWAAENNIAIDENAIRYFRNSVVQTYIELKAVKETA